MNYFCCLCFMFVFVAMSHLFLAVLWSPAGKKLSCVLCFLVFVSLSYVCLDLHQILW